MRIAVVSDVHGNLTALEAVLEDLKEVSPDLILHGGDLAGGGARSAEVVDRIRELGWQGVVGNSDESLFDPQSLQDFAKQSPALESLFKTIEEMAEASREELGAERLDWLRALPREQSHGSIAIVHASPTSAWRSPGHEAPDAELHHVYSTLEKRVVVYGHIHQPYVRKLTGLTVVNSGAVSLSYDGDYRAAYLLVDEDKPVIRRVPYNLDKELKSLAASGLPHSDWIAKSLSAARPQMP